LRYTSGPVRLARGISYILTESLVTHHNILLVPVLGHPAVEISQLDPLTTKRRRLVAQVNSLQFTVEGMLWCGRAASFALLDKVAPASVQSSSQSFVMKFGVEKRAGKPFEAW
jgi:hypothetical protein